MNAQIEIARLLKQAIGLDVASVGSSSLARAVRSRMAACGARNENHYWEQLQNSAAELQELIENLVVPETWFLRDREAFTALAKIVTTEWALRNLSRPLRVLSVPCSTGEEPYSIAIALLDAGVAPESFQIDALDISARALASAVRGSFGRNSFRGLDFEFRDRHFQPTAGRYEISPLVRERVRFQQANLVSTDFLKGAARYDVIFCRNVLIYFDTATQQQVIRNVADLLVDDGLLFVGPAEAFLMTSNGFVRAIERSAFAYRKSAAPPALSRRVNQHCARKRITPRSPAVKPTARPTPARLPQANGPADVLEVARRLADAGKLHEAARLCETHLREQGASPAALYLLALLRDAMGARREAADCYRKVIYLEPDHVDALIHLALLEQKRGDFAAARRLQLRAKRLEAPRR